MWFGSCLQYKQHELTAKAASMVIGRAAGCAARVAGTEVPPKRSSYRDGILLGPHSRPGAIRIKKSPSSNDKRNDLSTISTTKCSDQVRQVSQKMLSAWIPAVMALAATAGAAGLPNTIATLTTVTVTNTDPWPTDITMSPVPLPTVVEPAPTPCGQISICVDKLKTCGTTAVLTYGGCVVPPSCPAGKRWTD